MKKIFGYGLSHVFVAVALVFAAVLSSSCAVKVGGGKIVEAYSSVFPDGEHTLVVSYMGDPIFPYGADRVKVAVYEGKKVIASKVYEVYNDGARAEVMVKWKKRYAVVMLSGDEMEKDICVIINYDTPAVLMKTDKEPVETPKMVDLGLSVKWASANIGADESSRHGYHYAWGEITEKTAYEKWNYKVYASPVVLGSENDVCAYLLGNGWRLPTVAEWQELIDNCTWKVGKDNDVDGYIVTSNKGGASASIFLTYSGTIDGEENVEPRVSGGYWSSELAYDKGTISESTSDEELSNSISYGDMTKAPQEEIKSTKAYGLKISAEGPSVVGYDRYLGLSVRAVHP